MAKKPGNKGRRQLAKASGRTVELAVQRALAELDFAPGELSDDEYEVTIIIPPEEGFMGVGAVDAVVEVALTEEAFDFYGPGDDSQPEELLLSADDEDYDEYVDESPLLDEKDEVGRLRVFLERVLKEFGLDAQVRITESADELHAEITGDDLGIFIGRRGQTIDAVEYLASIAVFPGLHARKRVELDAEGYKERRQRQIERVATKKAQEAVKRGRPVQLNPMTPAERKIVHLTLKDRDDVTTASQGREPNRSVVITPVH